MRCKIGSFNLNNLSASNDKDFEKIAQIILEEELDVVALQEILKDGEVILEQNVNSYLYQWGVCCDFQSEGANAISGDKRGEGFAFLWNKKKFKLLEYKKLGNIETYKPHIINSESKKDVNTDCEFFMRKPYYIRLQPISGGYFELRLINVHLCFADDDSLRKKEFKCLTQEIFEKINDRRFGDNRAVFTIAMGDYNLNIDNYLVQTQAPSRFNIEQSVYSYVEDRTIVNVRTDQDRLTTVRRVVDQTDPNVTEKDWYANNYDHFTYQEEQFDKNSTVCMPIDAIKRYCKGDLSYYREKISDHLPVVIEIEL